MTDLRRFMAELAVNPALLAEFVHDPANGLKNAAIPAEEQAVLKTGQINDMWELLHGRRAGKQRLRQPRSRRRNRVSWRSWGPESAQSAS